MTSIAEAAAAALAAKREQDAAYEADLRDMTISLARKRLTEFFAGTTVDVALLEVVYADADQFVTVVTDQAAEPVHLAVDDDGDVRLVEYTDGAWTRASAVLPTLADLGAILEKKAVDSL